MYDMLRNMEPPVGFGKKCPYRLAYRVCIIKILYTYSLFYKNTGAAYLRFVEFYENKLSTMSSSNECLSIGS